MNIGGSAKDEMAARLGAVTGGFAKRFVTMAWGFAGLLALALWGANQADPDLTWGRLTLFLLPVGLIGLMIIGILGGKLASLGAQSIVLSALVVKNLYEPLFPGKTERHYIMVARISVPVILGLGILVALWMGNAISLFKFILAITVTWGAPILLIFQWRRLTRAAVIVQVIATILLIGVIPYVVPSIESLRQSPALTVMTRERTGMVRARPRQRTSRPAGRRMREKRFPRNASPKPCRSISRMAWCGKIHRISIPRRKASAASTSRSISSRCSA